MELLGILKPLDSSHVKRVAFLSKPTLVFLSEMNTTMENVWKILKLSS